MDRRKFVNKVFQTLEENHIYLYHDISKEEFDKHKNQFLNEVDTLDEIHFDAGMMRLFALFKDAHTIYQGERLNFVTIKPVLIGKDFYIKDKKGEWL